MIEQDYIPVELVERLKKAGFENEIKIHFGVIIIRPTIWQVLKWLREEKKMFVQISLFQYCYDYCILDTEMVYYDNEHKVLHQGPTGYSYNEAALAGIEYVLDNLI